MALTVLSVTGCFPSLMMLFWVHWGKQTQIIEGNVWLAD